ncbi:MAG: deoxyuridine 5'-triphosphate nucleotidohydrolase [archaeon GB-1867-035]|nr:deoxyuridine 5'-triphosphate nucleotidohydrolase [Candidatus Culexmicrobium profundum]
MVIPGHKVGKYGINIENIIHEIQIQPAGIELTLREIEKFEDAGYIDLTNIKRKISKCTPLQFDADGKIFLPQGAYKVRFNEIISIPANVIGIGLPRSSLLRSGATIFSAVWDPGYKGRSESLLVVFNPHGIFLEKNARLMQLLFIKLVEKPQKLYSGKYQFENIKEKIRGLS